MGTSALPSSAQPSWRSRAESRIRGECALDRGYGEVAMIDREKDELPSRDLPKERVREPNAVEISLGPAAEGGPQPVIHSHPTSQQIGLAHLGVSRIGRLPHRHEAPRCAT